MEGENPEMQVEGQDPGMAGQNQAADSLAQEEAFLEQQAQSLAEVKRRRKE